MSQLLEYAKTRLREKSNLIKLNGKSRTVMGEVMANKMVMKSVSNLADITGGFDPVYSSIRQFARRYSAKVKTNAAPDSPTAIPSYNQVAQRPSFNNTTTSRGISSVTGLQTVSAVDITVDMLIYSFLPWLAVERDIGGTSESISYKRIVAINNAGGVKKGDTVLGQFSTENTNLDLSSPVLELQATGDGNKMIVTFEKQIFNGTSLVSYKKKTPDTSVIGKDYDGLVAFPSISESFTVDYETGTFTSVGTIPDGDVVTFQVMVDINADTEGTNILRSTSKMDKVDLITKQTSIIIEDSVDKMLYIINNIKASNGTLSIEQYLAQMLFDMYVSYINNLLMTQLHKRYMEVANTADLVTKDLAPYGGQIIADPARKYDELANLIEEMQHKMLSTVNLSGTCIVVGTKVANLMVTDRERFIKSDEYGNNMNTLIGSYNGLPVLRHQYIDVHIDSKDADNYGHLFIVYRDTNGEVGYLAYGEFIPVHTTENVFNFQNPLQFARSLMSQVGVAVLNKNLCIVGRFRASQSA